MATKRAFQLLPFRASPVLLRAQCTATSRAWIAPIKNADTRVVRRNLTGKAPSPSHGQHVEPKPTKAYGFGEVQDIASSASTSQSHPILIDVREPSEHNANTIPSSINIPITSQPDALLLPPDEFEDRFGFAKPPLDAEVVFFCKAGVRSRAAAQVAKHAGYKNVGEYSGSWLDWERRGGVGTKG